MRKQVEMIISYTTDGTDYEYHDNHGVLIRCKDCIHWDERRGRKYCLEMHFDQSDPDFYCGYAERKE